MVALSFLLVLGFFVLLIIFPLFRCAVTHPVSSVRYAVTDLILYIKRKDYNICHTGELIAYTGLFGRGKTLSAVHRVVTAYRQYHGKMVWCPRRQKMVRQVIKVISNVAISIPYEQFVSLEQLVLAAEHNQEEDDENDTLTRTLALGDEFSAQMNSRNFRTNIDPLFLNTILTCRHYYISLYYTAQRFNHVDKLLREVTRTVIDCDKLWRFQRLNYYDAWDMENAASISLIKPLRRDCWFVRDRDYQAYNTLACVGNLKHDMKEGAMMTPEEILALQQNQGSDMDAVSRPSRRWLRRQRQRK